MRRARDAVAGVQPAAQRVDHQLLGQRPDEPVPALAEDRQQVRGTVDGTAVRQLPGRVDLELAVPRPPPANGVEVLEREAEGVHPRMAGGAVRIGAMPLKLVPQGRSGSAGLLVDRRNVSRRRGGRVAEQVVQNPLPPQHRRGARGIGGDGEDAGVREHAAARCSAQIDPPELGPAHPVNPVEPRQILVEVGVATVQKLQDASCRRARFSRRRSRSRVPSNAGGRNRIWRSGPCPASPTPALETAATGRRSSARVRRFRGSRSIRVTAASMPEGSERAPSSAACRSRSSGVVLQRKYERAGCEFEVVETPLLAGRRVALDPKQE